MAVPQSSAGGYQECGRSHSQCCPLQGSRDWQGHCGIVHLGQPGAWLGRGGRGAPAASPGTLTLLCQGSVPCLTGTSVFLCSFCTGVMGKPLICRINHIREVLFSAGSLSWGATWSE